MEDSIEVIIMGYTPIFHIFKDLLTVLTKHSHRAFTNVTDKPSEP